MTASVGLRPTRRLPAGSASGRRAVPSRYRRCFDGSFEISSVPLSFPLPPPRRIRIETVFEERKKREAYTHDKKPVITTLCRVGPELPDRYQPATGYRPIGEQRTEAKR